MYRDVEYLADFLFQHSAARRRLQPHSCKSFSLARVSTLSRAEAAAILVRLFVKNSKFQHSAARRRLHPT